VLSSAFVFCFCFLPSCRSAVEILSSVFLARFIVPHVVCLASLVETLDNASSTACSEAFTLTSTLFRLAFRLFNLLSTTLRRDRNISLPGCRPPTPHRVSPSVTHFLYLSFQSSRLSSYTQGVCTTFHERLFSIETRIRYFMAGARQKLQVPRLQLNIAL